jgi:large repetitive protein
MTCSIMLHEVGHVLGFTDAFAGFAQITQAGPDGGAFVEVAGEEVLVMADRDHLDGVAFANDLMSPTLTAGMRKLPSALDVSILRSAYQQNAAAGGSSGSAALRPNDGSGGMEALAAGSGILNSNFDVADPTATGFAW